VTSSGLFPLLGPGPAEVGALAVPVTPMPAATRCEVVDEFFRSGGGSSVLLTDPQRPHLLGLVSRGRFLQLMSGPFGFGHALFARALVSRVALWEPVVLDAGASVQQAAVAVLQREGDARYEEVVVEFGDHRWGTLSAAAVLEALSRALAEQAMFDGLTGLANRELLLSELTEALVGSGASSGAGGRVVVLFIDLDRFKQVNDVHGHNAGDVLLRAVADRLRAAARPGDVVARLGGDEFAVLLRVDAPPGVEPARVAGWVARRVLDALSVPVPVVGVNLLVGASIGVAVSAATGSDPQTLLREADLAMYEAKRAGGNRIHTVASVGTQLAALPGLAIDDTLSRALHDGEFVLHYQPIRDLCSGQVVSAEALIRWQHPQRGLRPPGEFLPAAQASGLIVQIDRWVLEQACRQLVRWDHDPGVTAPAWV